MTQFFFMPVGAGGYIVCQGCRLYAVNESRDVMTGNLLPYHAAADEVCGWCGHGPADAA